MAKGIIDSGIVSSLELKHDTLKPNPLKKIYKLKKKSTKKKKNTFLSRLLPINPLLMEEWRGKGVKQDEQKLDLLVSLSNLGEKRKAKKVTYFLHTMLKHSL